MLTILKSLRWYRKRKGGKWYKLFHNCNAAGFQSPFTWWTQTPEQYNDIEILEVENWSLGTQQTRSHNQSHQAEK